MFEKRSNLCLYEFTVMKRRMYAISLFWLYRQPNILNLFYKNFCSLLIYCPQLKFFRRQRRIYSGHSFTFIFYKTFILNVRKLIFAGFREGNKGISETAKFAFHTDHKNCILSHYPE